MKQKCIYPKNVFKVELTSNKNGDFYLTGLEKTNDERPFKEWIFKLPSGTWYISEQNFETREIILWNGLVDVQDKFAYYTETFSIFDTGNLQQYLNKKSEQGSELVGVFEFNLIFKHKI